MLSVQRRDELRHILMAKKSVTVAEIAQHFGVSTETIRRDFDYLAKEGFLEKSYGGATVKTRMANMVPQQVKSGILVENKRRMAKAAVEFLNPHDSIFLDHSTTVYEMCQEIENMPLTVMTNSLYAVNHLSRRPNIKLVCPGGNFNLHHQGFFGLEAMEFLRRHYLDKAFLSCRALHQSQALCDSEEETAALRKTIIEHAETTYLLADHTKFGKPSFVHIMPVERVHTLITDTELPEEWRTHLASRGVKVVERTV